MQARISTTSCPRTIRRLIGTVNWRSLLWEGSSERQQRSRRRKKSPPESGWAFCFTVSGSSQRRSGDDDLFIQRRPFLVQPFFFDLPSNRREALPTHPQRHRRLHIH